MNTTTKTDVAAIENVLAPMQGAIDAAKKGDLVVAGLSPVKDKSSLSPERPKWMTEQDETAAQGMAKNLVSEVKRNPGDVRLLSKAQSLGADGDKQMVQPLALYEKRVTVTLRDNQEGSTSRKTLLDVKRQMDLVNPAVLRNKPLPIRWALGLLSRMPKGDEVLKMVYENRATVTSTVNGLVTDLRMDADAKEADLEDVARIYEQLLAGQRLIERDIYVGQLVIEQLKKHLTTMEDGPEKDNVTQFVADLTTAVIFRMDEENMNLQFFAGAQAYAKLCISHLHLVRNLIPLLQRSVMANLGLNVATAELEASTRMTREISDAIGNTVADTAGRLEKTGERLAKMRAEGGINLERLEEACSAMERFFEKQAEANQLIIEQGGTTMRKLGDMSGRLRRRVESGHESMLEGAERASAA